MEHRLSQGYKALLLTGSKICCDSLRGGQIGLFYSLLCLPAALSTAWSH